MSEWNRTVLVDMDGVMANFDGATLTNVPSQLIVPRTHFYVADDYPNDLRASIEAVYNAPGFFETLEPMPGLMEAWQTMLTKGYHPRVASAPLSSNPTSREGKLKWLERVMVPAFGKSVVDRAIIDKEKWRHSGLALIDDRPDVPRGLGTKDSADWEHILFGWPHLPTIEGATANYRILDWQDPDELIQVLDDIAKRVNHS